MVKGLIVGNTLTGHCVGVSPLGGVLCAAAQNKDMQYSSGIQPERYARPKNAH